MESGKSGLVTAMSVQMRAEIFSYGQGMIRGELHSIYLDTPFEFTSLVRMIEKMEEIFDTKGFPEAFLSSRTFGGKKYEASKSSAERGEVMKSKTEQQKQKEPGSSKCTFEITVKFRQNATWQGQILWAEKNLKQNFRSVLEMLKLMDEALTEGQDEQESITWEVSEQNG